MKIKAFWIACSIGYGIQTLINIYILIRSELVYLENNQLNKT